VKLFISIFAIYILLLSAIPCCAFDNCNNTEQSTSNHNDDCKNCSPFAVCGNCTGFTNIAMPIQVSSLHFLTGNDYPLFILAQIPQHTFSFWQPPKIG
jgi:hypothetical protein